MWHFIQSNLKLALIGRFISFNHHNFYIDFYKLILLLSFTDSYCLLIPVISIRFVLGRNFDTGFYLSARDGPEEFIT